VDGEPLGQQRLADHAREEAIRSLEETFPQVGRAVLTRTLVACDSDLNATFNLLLDQHGEATFGARAARSHGAPPATAAQGMSSAAASREEAWQSTGRVPPASKRAKPTPRWMAQPARALCPISACCSLTSPLPFSGARLLGSTTAAQEARARAKGTPARKRVRKRLTRMHGTQPSWTF
jgi:hypothetical protein